MPLSSVQAILNAFLVVLEGAILVFMLKRKLNKTFPLFFSFMAFTAFSTIVVTATYSFAFKQYFAVYWSASTVMMLIGFGVLYEVFVNVFKPYSAVIDLGKMLFGWAALFLLLAALLTALFTAGPRPRGIFMCVELLDRCVHLMQCGMLMLLVLLERRLNFSWRSTSMAIGMGLGLTAAADLLASYLPQLFPAQASQIEASYVLVLIGVFAFWSTVFMSPARSRKIVPDSPSRLILQRWNEALISYGYGELNASAASAESFLPGVERTVARVMARKMVH
ncbi:MAG: hypothetical protein LAO20_12505 [Acidobacteriia bacterium]|nr:hypothetical protein [Terriglobia bacterium]